MGISQQGRLGLGILGSREDLLGFLNFGQCELYTLCLQPLIPLPGKAVTLCLGSNGVRFSKDCSALKG